MPPGKIESLPFSVNRARHSQPEDVVFGYPNFGIAAIAVQDIPAPIISENKIRYEFRVVHDPVENDYLNNYPHAEVRVFKNGLAVESKKVGLQVKASFRQSISDKTRILRQPGRVQ